MKRTIIQIFCIAGVALGIGTGATSAKALVVETDGKVVFDSAGFENGVLEVFPVAPSVGTYRFNQEGKVVVSTGKSDVDGGPDGAASGKHYLTADRSGGGAIRTAEFSEPIDPSKQSFSIEWADWGQGGLTAYSVGAQGSDATSGSSDNLLSAFGVHSGGEGPNETRFVSFNSKKMGGTTTLDLPYKFEQWNLMRYEWDADKQQATLTVNGTSAQLKMHSDVMPDSIGQFFFRGNAGGAVVFIDSIANKNSAPE